VRNPTAGHLTSATRYLVGMVLVALLLACQAGPSARPGHAQRTVEPAQTEQVVANDSS